MKVLDENKIVKNPLVTVQVFAYNKEKYIRECLDSILEQETSFEYEILVMENPGEDRTREICVEYQKNHPDRIILVLREKNMGFYYNYYDAAKISRGKYIARCDGDDFWCNKEKLQMQATFLESNQDYGCCYTFSMVYDDEAQQYCNVLGGLPWKGFKADLLRESIQQPSVMYRKDLFFKYLEDIKPENRGWRMEDTPRTYWFANNSKIARLDKVTAVYRVVKNSASHLTDYDKQELYHKSILDIRLFFYKMYCPNETELIKPLYNDYYTRNMEAAYNAGKLKKYIENYIRYKGFQPYPFFVNTYRLLIMLKQKIVK